MVPDGRRLVRAGMLAVAVFLFVGGGVGFAVAAGQDGEALRVPAPRPGDRATYSVAKQLLPDLELGGWGDIRLDEVVYEWLPGRTLLDRTFTERASHPLQATYIFRWEGNEARYTKVVDHDALTGEPFHTSVSRATTSQTSLLPGVIGQVGLGVDRVLQPPAHVWTTSDHYAWYMAIPCGQRSALHGLPGTEVPDQLHLGSCGWPALHDPVFHPVGWETLASGERAYRFQGDTGPLLNAWYTSGSPFPARLTSPMREIVDPAWTIGRLFTLERTAWARGPSDYPAPASAEAGAASASQPPDGNPVALVPVTQPWALDDAGLGGDLPIAVAYAEVEKAPRTGSGHGTDALLGLYRPQPSVREWLAAHPDGYLAEADRYVDGDRYGEANPGWLFLWVDGPSWLGKVVSLESSAGDESVVYLPGAAPKRLRVSDWTPSPSVGIEDYVARFPRRDQLPDALPAAAGVAERFLAAHPGGGITYYGFRWTCEGPTCAGAGALAWAGRSTSTFDPNTGAMGGDAITAGLTVDKQGLALAQYHQRREADPVLGLGAPAEEETPPPAPSRSAAGVWAAPASPAATAGIGLLALLSGALYYAWPLLKGLPAAGLFSRLREDRLLEHPVRRRIHDAVQAEPGLHFQELARRLAVGNGALDHHLHKLVAAGLLTVRKAPGYTCYFPKATDRRVMDAAPSLRSGGSRLVLEAVAQKPGASSRDLASHLGLAPSTVSYHLKRLETAGLVLPGASAGVRLTPLGEQAQARAAA